MVVNQGHGEGDGVVVTHQCEQHPRVGGRAYLSFDLYFPGCFSPDVWRCSCCNEGGASGGDTGERKAGLSRARVRATAPGPALGGGDAAQLQKQVGSCAAARRWPFKEASLSKPTAHS